MREEQPAPASVGPPPTLVAPYADFIHETLALYPHLRATRLYDMARDRGYAGSVRPLCDFIASVRPVPRQEAYLRLEPLIGEQAQVDWAHVARKRSRVESTYGS